MIITTSHLIKIIVQIWVTTISTHTHTKKCEYSKMTQLTFNKSKSRDETIHFSSRLASVGLLVSLT